MKLKQDSVLFFASQSKGSATRAFVFFFCLLLTANFSLASIIICKNEKAVRTLRADKTEVGCSAIYTKQGIDQIVGSSTKENACSSILENIRKTLETSIWKCKDVKQASVSQLSE